MFILVILLFFYCIINKTSLFFFFIYIYKFVYLKLLKRVFVTLNVENLELAIAGMEILKEISWNTELDISNLVESV